MNNDMNRKSIYIFVGILLICLSGCSSFTVNQDIRGKRISIRDRAFVIDTHDSRNKIEIYYKGKLCPIINVVQNSSLTLATAKVGILESKKYRLNDKSMRIMPRRFILMISGKNIIFSLEDPFPNYIHWINNDRLEIVSSHERITINGRGKILSRSRFADNQLTDIPPEALF